MTIYKELCEAKSRGKKKFAVLLDPDKIRLSNLDSILKLAVDAGVDYFFIGGSLIVNDMLDQLLESLKDACKIPLVLFPGNSYQISNMADAILFLSLISGRNSELLIGKHVLAAPYLKRSSLEVISTGYILVDGGVSSTVSYMSNTIPIPSDKNNIALSTAMAGELLGMKMIYLEAGSGARKPVSQSMIKEVSNAIDIPLIVGGGINSPEKAKDSVEAGADLIVVGNAIEEDPELIIDLSVAIHSVTSVVQ